MKHYATLQVPLEHSDWRIQMAEELGGTMVIAEGPHPNPAMERLEELSAGGWQVLSAHFYESPMSQPRWELFLVRG